MPFLAPTPVPTIIATGVASPKAQGQEITSTAMAEETAASKPPPASIHTKKVTSAIAITAGTNTPAILSASRAMGALEEEASSTRRIIWDKVVSSPTFKALQTSLPALFIVADTTGSPGCFSTGILSPVIAASLMLEVPSTTTPSAGTRLPGFTTNKSSFLSWCVGISFSSPFSVSRIAVFGERSINFSIASLVFPFERVSKYFPTVISASIMPADSKYRSDAYLLTSASFPCPNP